MHAEEAEKPLFEWRSDGSPGRHAVAGMVGCMDRDAEARQTYMAQMSMDDLHLVRSSVSQFSIQIAW